MSNTEEQDPTMTAGKVSFHDVYDAPDAAPYMRAMKDVDYVIGDNSGNVSRRAIADLCAPKPAAEGEGGGEAPALESVPVVLELCSGYGLSIAVIRTSHTCASLFEHYAQGGETRTEEEIAADGPFLASRPRPDFPKICVVGVDVASHALNYGKSVGLFDATLAKNLEDPETKLTEAEVALLSRSQVVLATGAFSYISAKTLSHVFSAHANDTPPVFCFYPLVATEAEPIVEFFKERGMQVYYEPSKHWLAQRKFASEAEKEKMSAIQDAKAKGGNPRGKREGYVHATPLIAAPAGMDLATLAPKWIDGPEVVARAGGVGGVEAATPALQAMCESLKASMLEKARRSGWNGVFAQFEVQGFKKQVVAGYNYFVKITVSDTTFVHARIFCALPHTGLEPEVVAVKVVDDAAALDYF